MKPPKSVTCSRPLPSRLIRNSSNLRVSQAFLLDENRIFLPSGVKVGAKLAHPKLVMVLAFSPLASATTSSIFMGAVTLFASRLL